MQGNINPIAFDATAPTRLNTVSISPTPIAIPTAIENNIPVYM